jgi:hypothetical protein
MNVNDARQVVYRRKKKRRSFEQSSHQALFEEMKKTCEAHIKRKIDAEFARR